MTESLRFRIETGNKTRHMVTSNSDKRRQGNKARQQDKATVTDGRYPAHVRTVSAAGFSTCDSERRFLSVRTIYDMSTRA